MFSQVHQGVYMNLLCLRCGNATYFETEVETVVEVMVIEGGIKYQILY
jgi:hypothetical protein